MDKKINIALVGYGKFGKIYEKELKKIKSYNLIKIYRKKKLKNQKFDIINFKKKIDKKLNLRAVIIASDIQSHFKIAKYFISNNISIILEKPACETLAQIEELKKKMKKKNISLIVNYSDTFNENYISLIKNIKKIGKIQKIKAQNVSAQTIYRIKDKTLPFFDWAPHPLSLITKIIKKKPTIVYLKNEINLKNRNFFQKISLRFKSENIDIEIFFENLNKNKKRKLLIQGTKGQINYDGYKNKNNYFFINNHKEFISLKSQVTPINNLLKKFESLILSKKKYNNLNQTIHIHKIINNITNHDNYNYCNIQK